MWVHLVHRMRVPPASHPSLNFPPHRGQHTVPCWVTPVVRCPSRGCEVPSPAVQAPGSLTKWVSGSVCGADITDLVLKSASMPEDEDTTESFRRLF